MTELSAKQRDAATRLAAGESVGDVASAVSVTGVTLWRWRKNPIFNQAVVHIRLDFARQGLQGLAAGTRTAIAVLVEMAQDCTVQASTRYLCAKSLLDAGLRDGHAIELMNETLKLIEAEERIINAEFTSHP